jgi:hypothetical protein
MKKIVTSALLMQWFFMTKPTGEGTGSGLSLAYDMVLKDIREECKLITVEGTELEFIIQIPVK